MLANKLDLLGVDLAIGRGFGFPDDFFANREILPLFSTEVLSNQGAVRASEIID